jgi:exosortase
LDTDLQTSARKSWLSPALMAQAAILIALLGYHYRYVIMSMMSAWYNKSDWSHGFIIPLFSIYFLYTQRHRFPRDLHTRDALPRILGLGLMALAFGIYLASTFFLKMEYPRRISLVMAIMGSVMVVWGWPVARWSWFAVGFLLFALPLPDRVYRELTIPLRNVAANVSAFVLSLVPDMQAEAQGALVEYFYQGRADTLDIERACSGMRLLMTMMALGVAMAFIHERPIWQRLLMIMACVPIAIFCNIIRVTTTGFLVVFGQHELAQGTPHTMLGLGMLLIAFGLFGAISYVLRHLFVEDQTEATVVHEQGSMRG